MTALRRLLEKLDRTFGFTVAYAHCDIPCGIYDPHAAQVAAHTIVRMDMLIADLEKAPMDIEARNKLIRCVKVKEEHAEKCENEIMTLWNDYFKPDHIKANPELSTLVYDTVQKASKARQSTKIADADALVESVEKVAEIFWKTKNVPTLRVKSFYPTERTFVYPKV